MKRLLFFFLLLFALSLPVFSSNEQYDFQFPKGTSLNTALYAIAYRADRDIAINVPDTMILANLRARTAEEALDILAKVYNFNWMIENNTIYVTPPEQNTKNQRFVIKNADLKLVKEELLSFIPENKIRINPEYNSITIDGTPGIIHKAEEVITKLDQPVDQIFIMAQMIEVNRKDSLKLGFQYTLPGYDNSVQPFRAQFTVTSAGERTFDNGTVLARPAVTTFNGLEATLHMGDQVPVIRSDTAINGTIDSNITFEEVGAKLKVTPFVNDKEKKIITLILEPSISSVVKWIESGSVIAPQISTRTANTKVRVKSGDNIVIGGLMRQSDIENLKGIPGLMKLPILGKLFQHKEKSKEHTEVFFIVTPYLLDDDTTLESFQKMMRKKDAKEALEIPKKKAKKNKTQPKIIAEQEKLEHGNQETWLNETTPNSSAENNKNSEKQPVLVDIDLQPAKKEGN